MANHRRCNVILCYVCYSEAVRGRDVTGKTSFHHFVAMGDLDSLSKLSLYYLPAEDYDTDGVTLLMYSCARTEAGQMTVTRYLVETLRVDVTAVDSLKRNALMHAVLASNQEALVYLLESGNYFLADDKDGVNPLLVACANGNQAIADILLQSKGAKDLALRTDNSRRNAFHFCAMNGHLSCVSLLKAHHCDINARDERGRTALVYAIRGGHFEMVAPLVRRGADVNLCDNLQQSALHHCFDVTTPNVK